MSVSLGSGLTLLLGGARSGKSDLAVQLGAAWSGDVTFVATATAGDDDMASRIERHQAERPAGWSLLESPLFGADHVSDLGADDLVIVDCITLLVANQLFADRTEDAVTSHISELGQALAARTAPTLAISNEVGLGVHPEHKLGRTYRDMLGRANRAMADHAELSLLVIAGKVLPLETLTTTWP